jgi:hypothetical protein
MKPKKPLAAGLKGLVKELENGAFSDSCGILR